MWARKKKLKMMRAGHRAKHVFLVVYYNRRIHRILVMRIVTAFFVEFKFGYVRCFYMRVAAFNLFIDYEALQFAAYCRTFLGEEGKALAARFGKSKKIKPAPDLFMTAGLQGPCREFF